MDYIKYTNLQAYFVVVVVDGGGGGGVCVCVLIQTMWCKQRVLEC